MPYPSVELSLSTYEVTTRNVGGVAAKVYSVTNTQGFVPSEAFFSKQVYSQEIRSYKVVQPGNFAYNPSRINVGSIDYLRADFPVAVSPMYVVFGLREDLIDRDYLLFFLKSDLGLGWINSRAAGTVRNVLRFTDLGSIHIPLPSIFEQRYIATTLRFTHYLRGLRRDVDAKIKQLYQALFYQRFGSGKPTARHPETVKLRDLLEVPLTSGFSPNTNDSPSGIAVFTLSAVTDFGLDEHQVKYYPADNYSGKGDDLKVDDILVTRSNTLELVGRAARYRGRPSPVIYPDLMIRIRLRNVEDSPYVENFLRCHYMVSVIRRLARGTSGSMKKISQSDINDFDVLWPPEDERRSYSALVRQIDHRREQLDLSMNKLDLLLQSLLNQAFKGALTLALEKKQSSPLSASRAERDRLLENLRLVSIQQPDLWADAMLENQEERGYLLSALDRDQRSLLQTVKGTKRYFTPESLSVVSGFDLDTVHRHLEFFASVGLIKSVSLSETPVGDTVFVPVYRSLLSDDDTRERDILFLEGIIP